MVRHRKNRKALGLSVSNICFKSSLKDCGFLSSGQTPDENSRKKNNLLNSDFFHHQSQIVQDSNSFH